MNTLEKYFSSLLIEEECDKAMNRILDKMFEASSAPQPNSYINTSAQINTSIYYVIDPFPFLFFDSTKNKISNKVVSYCTQALDDYNSHKDSYKSLCFLPPYIKDTLQLTVFTTITRGYILSELANNIQGIEKVKEFYNLLNSPKIEKQNDDYVFTNFKSWNSFKSIMSSHPNYRVFVPEDIGPKGGYEGIKTSNAKVAQNIYIDYNSNIIPVMKKISELAITFKNEKNNISVKNNLKYNNEYEKYLSYLIANCSMDTVSTNISVLNVTNGKPSKIESNQIDGRNKNFDRDTYKNSRLNPQIDTIEYWKDSELGQGVEQLNKIANGESDDWKKTLNKLNHTFNRDLVDKDLEKIYNLKHFAPDVLGLESEHTRYDARKYEDPNRRKIKGISGHDIYEHDKKIQQLMDENDELMKKISVENDEKEIEKLQKQMDANNEEIDIIKQRLDSHEEHSNRVEKKYKDKIKDIGFAKKEIDESDFAKAEVFITSHKNDVSVINAKLVSN